MSKKNLIMKGLVSDGISDDVDVLGFYRNVFPSAIPLVYNHGEENLLESRIQEVYGDSFFLIYKPLGMMGFMRDNENAFPFYLILVKNAYTFDKYVSFFFNQPGRGGCRDNLILRHNKIKCFGSVKLLMLNEDKLYSRYHNAIALAFKDGNKPFDGGRTATYLYHDDKLVETPTFFRWNDNIEKDFEQNER